MDKSSLKDLFGLKERPKSVEITEAPSELEVSSFDTKESSKSKTVLEHDSWSLRKGDELAPLTVTKCIEGIDVEKTLSDVHSTADFFSLFYENEPKFMDDCEDKDRYSFLKGIVDTEDYRKIHNETMFKPEFAQMATETLAFKWIERKEKIEERKQEMPGECKSKEPSPGGIDMDEMRDISKALSEIKKEVSEAKDLEDGLAGMGAGGPGSLLDLTRLASLQKRVRNSPVIKRILEHAGKFRRLARAKQKSKLDHGQDEFVNITLGNEISKLLTSELMLLGDDDLELEFLRRFVEKECLMKEMAEIVTIGKGPIIPCVDTSGSMIGEKIETAKALALTMAWIAFYQKRWCGLVSFSGNTGHSLLTLPPNRSEISPDALLNWLELFHSGGSNRDVPVVEMPEFYRQLGAPIGKTDIFFITDAICDLSTREMSDFMDWKKEVHAKLISLVLIGGNRKEIVSNKLKSISDEYYQLPSIGLDEEGVSRTLSI